MINVGDYVKVKGEGRHRGWMPYMDSFIGTVYKVTNVVREVDEEALNGPGYSCYELNGLWFADDEIVKMVEEVR